MTNAGTYIQHHTLLCMLLCMLLQHSTSAGTIMQLRHHLSLSKFQRRLRVKGDSGTAGFRVASRPGLGEDRLLHNIVGLLQLPQDVTTVTHSSTLALTQDVLRVREKVYEVRISCSISPCRDSSYLFSSSLSTT